MGRERGGETIVMWLFGRRGDFYWGRGGGIGGALLSGLFREGRTDRDVMG